MIIKTIFQSKIKRKPVKTDFRSADGGIRTLVPRRANAFRVRPVMTTSIRLLNVVRRDPRSGRIPYYTWRAFRRRRTSDGPTLLTTRRALHSTKSNSNARVSLHFSDYKQINLFRQLTASQSSWLRRSRSGYQ